MKAPNSTDSLPAAEPPLLPKEKERLLRRLYADPLWIAIVRLIRYAALPTEDVFAQTRPLVEEHGPDAVALACETLLVGFRQGPTSLVRLRPPILRMAFQLIGPDVPRAAGDPGSPNGPARKDAAKKSSPGPRKRPKKS